MKYQQAIFQMAFLQIQIFNSFLHDASRPLLSSVGNGSLELPQGTAVCKRKDKIPRTRELTSSCTYLYSPLLSVHLISHPLIKKRLPINSREHPPLKQSQPLSHRESLSYTHMLTHHPSSIISRNTILACTITKSPQLPTHPKWWGWLCLTMAACRDAFPYKWADASSDIKSHFNWWLGIRHIILPGYRATNHLTPSDLVD